MYLNVVLCDFFGGFTALQPFTMPPNQTKKNIVSLVTKFKIIELKKIQINGIVTCLFIVLCVTCFKIQVVGQCCTLLRLLVMNTQAHFLCFLNKIILIHKQS